MLSAGFEQDTSNQAAADHRLRLHGYLYPSPVRIHAPSHRPTIANNICNTWTAHFLFKNHKSVRTVHEGPVIHRPRARCYQPSSLLI